MTQDEELEEIRARKFRIEKLLQSEGWQDLESLFREMRLSRRNGIFSMDTEGIDALIKMGNAQAELAGMELVMSLPQVIISELELEETALLQVIRDETMDE